MINKQKNNSLATDNSKGVKVLSGEIVAIKSGTKYLVNVDKLIEYLNTATIKEPEKADTRVMKPIPVKLY